MTITATTKWAQPLIATPYGVAIRPGDNMSISYEGSIENWLIAQGYATAYNPQPAPEDCRPKEGSAASEPPATAPLLAETPAATTNEGKQARKTGAKKK